MNLKFLRDLFTKLLLLALVVLGIYILREMVHGQFDYAWRNFLAALAVIFLVGLLARWADEEQQRDMQSKVQQAQALAAGNQEKAKPAWDLARVTLDLYFKRNLVQVNLIFVIAVVVMFMGFAFIILSLSHALDQSKTQVDMVGAAAGIVTEFIGATFMLLYRSTMSQANSYVCILERINTVGMAVQVLDSIPDGVPEKNAGRIQVITSLLEANKAQVQAQSSGEQS